MATACHEGRPTGHRRNKGTAHRRTGTPQAGSKGARDTGAGQRKDRDELRYNGYVLIKGKRLKNFKLQFGHIINEVTQTTVQGKRPPPPAEEAKGLLTPLKIRAIFLPKPFSMQLNLAKSHFWSRKSRGG